LVTAAAAVLRPVGGHAAEVVGLGGCQVLLAMLLLLLLLLLLLVLLLLRLWGHSMPLLLTWLLVAVELLQLRLLLLCAFQCLVDVVHQLLQALEQLCHVISSCTHISRHLIHL
jgi:nitrate/nitrite transporter NarK